MAVERKILLIDDDPGFARMIAMLVSGFRGERFHLDHAANCASGRERLRSGDYALCLLDYHLGDGDGLGLLREATAEGCAIPIIFLSGSVREETDLAALDGGALDYLAKSELTPRGLERAINYALKLAGSMARLQDLAMHDELTGAFNRREFERRLQQEWESGLQFRRPFAVVMIDIDEFKATNDQHGHPAGDAVLRHLVAVISARLRKGDMLCRYGGDEFGLLLVDSNRETAQAVAERLTAGLVENPCHLPGSELELPVRISAGVASWPGDATNIETLIAAADAELYAVKREARRARHARCA
jgi:diguanylate cyclase (GGDEF)-like protein